MEPPSSSPKPGPHIIVGGDGSRTEVPLEQAALRAPVSSEKAQLSIGWKVFLVFAALLVVGPLALFIAGWLSLIAAANNGQSGTEFMFLLLIPLVLLAFVAAVINVIVIPLALKRRSFTPSWKVVSIGTLVVSVLLVLLGSVILVANVVGFRSASQKQTAYQAQNDQQRAEDAVTMVPKALTVEEAAVLLEQCKVFGFYYVGGVETEYSKEADMLAAERSATGIVSIEIPHNHMYRLHIAPRQEQMMVQKARSVQAKCGGPQFWHDGRYEQQKADGTWE